MQKETRVLTTHVPIELAKKVDAMAAQMERTRNWVVKEALREWIAFEEWKDAKTLKALAEVEAGHVVSQEEVERWFQSLTHPKKTSKPARPAKRK